MDIVRDPEMRQTQRSQNNYLTQGEMDFAMVEQSIEESNPSQNNYLTQGEMDLNVSEEDTFDFLKVSK